MAVRRGERDSPARFRTGDGEHICTSIGEGRSSSAVASVLARVNGVLDERFMGLTFFSRGLSSSESVERSFVRGDTESSRSDSDRGGRELRCICSGRRLVGVEERATGCLNSVSEDEVEKEVRDVA